MSQLPLLGEAVSTDMSASRSGVGVDQRELLLGIVDWIKHKSGPNFMCHRGPGQLEIICCLPYILSCASQNGELPKDSLDRRKPILILAMEEDCLSCLESCLSTGYDNKQEALLTRLGFMTDAQSKRGPTYSTFVIKNAFDATWFQVAPKVHVDIVLCSHTYYSCLPGDSCSVVVLFGKHKLSLTEELRIKFKFEQHNKIIQLVDPSLDGPAKVKPITKYLEGFRGSSDDSISTGSSSTSVKLMGRIAIDGIPKFKFYKLRRVHPYTEQLEQCASSEKQLLMMPENLNELAQTGNKSDKVLVEEHHLNSSRQAPSETADVIDTKDTEQDFLNASFSEQQLSYDRDDNGDSGIPAAESETRTKETGSFPPEIRSDHMIHEQQDCTERADLSCILEKLSESSNISKENASNKDLKACTHTDAWETDSVKSVSITGNEKIVSNTDFYNNSRHSSSSTSVPGNEHLSTQQPQDASVKTTEWEVEHTGMQEQDECADDHYPDYHGNSMENYAANLVDARLPEEQMVPLNTNSSEHNSQRSGLGSNASDQESAFGGKVTTDIAVVGPTEMSLWHEMRSDLSINEHHDSADNASIPEELSENASVNEQTLFTSANKPSTDYSVKNVSQKISSNECNFDHFISPELESVPDNCEFATTGFPNTSMTTEQWAEHGGAETLEDCAEKDDHDEIRSEPRGNCDAFLEDKKYEEIDDYSSLAENQTLPHTNITSENDFNQFSNLVPGKDSTMLEQDCELKSDKNQDLQSGTETKGSTLLEQNSVARYDSELEAKLLKQLSGSGTDMNNTVLPKQLSGSGTEMKGVLEQSSMSRRESEQETNNTVLPKQLSGSGTEMKGVLEQSSMSRRESEQETNNTVLPKQLSGSGTEMKGVLEQSSMSRRESEQETNNTVLPKQLSGSGTEMKGVLEQSSMSRRESEPEMNNTVLPKQLSGSGTEMKGVLEQSSMSRRDSEPEMNNTVLPKQLSGSGTEINSITLLEKDSNLAINGTPQLEQGRQFGPETNSSAVLVHDDDSKSAALTTDWEHECLLEQEIPSTESTPQHGNLASINDGFENYGEESGLRQAMYDNATLEQDSKFKSEIDRTESERPEVESKRPEVESERPEVESKRPEVESERPEVESERPEVGSERPEVESKRPEVESKRPEVESKRPEVESKRPEVESERPEVESKRPEVESKRPEVESKRPEVESERPEVGSECNRDPAFDLYNEGLYDTGNQTTSRLETEKVIPKLNSNHDNTTLSNLKDDKADHNSKQLECGYNDESNLTSKSNSPERIQEHNTSSENEVVLLPSYAKDQAGVMTCETDDLNTTANPPSAVNGELTQEKEQNTGLQHQDTLESFDSQTGIHQLTVDKELTAGLQEHQDSSELLDSQAGAHLHTESKPNMSSVSANEITAKRSDHMDSSNENVRRSKSNTVSAQSVSSVGRNQVLLLLSLSAISGSILPSGPASTASSNSDKAFVQPSFEGLSPYHSDDANASQHSA